jgi:methylglutaconyl-CoA hydratase
MTLGPNDVIFVPMADKNEYVRVEKRDLIGEICFFSPKANALSRALLKELAAAVNKLAGETDVHVIALRSDGEGAFCGGASFEEFKRLSTPEESRDFFWGFAEVILSMRRAEKLVIARVQGKAVGGGVGLIAAADYVCAGEQASARLSEFELGIGPFTIGPAVERKIGAAAFAAMSIDCSWRDAGWLLEHGLFASVSRKPAELEQAFAAVLGRAAAAPLSASREIKLMLWQGVPDWEELLRERAAISGRLLLERRESGLV